MPLHMGKLVILAAVSGSAFLLGTNPAGAVQCPAEVGGHPMRLMEGGTLFFGDPAKLGSQAPDGTRQGPHGPVNTWTFRNAANMTLVCKYEGVSRPVLISLPADTLICRQDINARSFVCQ